MSNAVIPRTQELDAALVALDMYTDVAPSLFRLVDDSADDWPVVLAEYSDWTQWPVREQMAFAHFLDAVWVARLSSFPAVVLLDDAESVLCGLAHACDGVRMFLDHWVGRTDQPAVRHLAQFVAGNAGEVAGKARLCNAFWDDRPKQMGQVIAWLYEPAIADALEYGYFASVHADVRAELADAADRLRALQPAR